MSSQDRGIYLLKTCYQLSTTDQFDDQGTSYSILFTSSLPGMRQVTVHSKMAHNLCSCHILHIRFYYMPQINTQYELYENYKIHKTLDCESLL